MGREGDGAGGGGFRSGGASIPSSSSCLAFTRREVCVCVRVGGVGQVRWGLHTSPLVLLGFQGQGIGRSRMGFGDRVLRARVLGTLGFCVHAPA